MSRCSHVSDSSCIEEKNFGFQKRHTLLYFNIEYAKMTTVFGNKKDVPEPVRFLLEKVKLFMMTYVPEDIRAPKAPV